MPQTSAEKKFLQARVSKTHDNSNPKTAQKFTVARIQGFQKNITKGAA